MPLFRKNTGALDGEFKIKGEKKPLQAKFYGTDKKAYRSITEQRWIRY